MTLPLSSCHYHYFWDYYRQLSRCICLRLHYARCRRSVYLCSIYTYILLIYLRWRQEWKIERAFSSCFDLGIEIFYSTIIDSVWQLIRPTRSAMNCRQHRDVQNLYTALRKKLVVSVSKVIGCDISTKQRWVERKNTLVVIRRNFDVLHLLLRKVAVRQDWK